MNAANPITRISAAGEPFEVGFAIGAAVARTVRERVFATTEFKALEARWRGSDRLGGLEFAARGAFPEVVREIEGMAAGAELDFETLFLWNCRGDLRLPPDGPEAEGCTSVLLPAVDGPAVIAHNEDGDAEFMGHGFWLSAEPADGPAFESFLYPGMLAGHAFGLNAAGLVQTINNIRVHDLQVGVPRHVITRAVLAARALDDAVALLKRTDRASGFHHNLGQAGSRRLLSVEAPASGCRVNEVKAPTAHANHLVDADFADTPQEVTQSSRLRQERAEAMLNDGVGDPEAILFDHEAPIYRANDGGDDYAQTLATAVFQLHGDRVSWRVHASPRETDALTGDFALAAA